MDFLSNRQALFTINSTGSELEPIKVIEVATVEAGALPSLPVVPPTSITPLVPPEQEPLLNKAHYNVATKYFWRMYFDRLLAFGKRVNKFNLTSIEFSQTGDLILTGENSATIFPFLANLFSAYELDRKIVIPNWLLDECSTDKTLWLYCSKLFNDEENALIFESYVAKYFPGSVKSFASRFFKYLNRIIDLQEVIKKAGIQAVRYLDTGVEFEWPIYYVGQATMTQIITADIPGVEFKRDELKKIERLKVAYDFAWAAIAGTSWSGDLNELFENVESYKNIKSQLDKVDVEKYSYCADMVALELGITRDL